MQRRQSPITGQTSLLSSQSLPSCVGEEGEAMAAILEFKRTPCRGSFSEEFLKAQVEGQRVPALYQGFYWPVLPAFASVVKGRQAECWAPCCVLQGKCTGNRPTWVDPGQHRSRLSFQTGPYQGAGNSGQGRRALRLVSQGLVVGPAPKHKWRGSVSLRFISGVLLACASGFPLVVTRRQATDGRRAVCCRVNVERTALPG